MERRCALPCLGGRRMLRDECWVAHMDTGAARGERSGRWDFVGVQWHYRPAGRSAERLGAGSLEGAGCRVEGDVARLLQIEC